MAEKDIRVGVIGCGRISDAHIEGYKSFDGAQVVAVCDIDEAKAKAKAEEHGGLKYYTDYRKLIESGEIDAVSICSTSPTHAEITIASAEAGLHVLCDKPMAQSLKQCDDMIQAARENNVVYSGVYQNRFNPCAQRIKQLIDTGKMGDCIMAKAYTWTTHVFDLTQWLMGPPARIYAEWPGQQRVGGDPLIATVMFQNGNMGIVQASYGFLEPPPIQECPPWYISILGRRLTAHFMLFSDKMRLESENEEWLKEAEASIENTFTEPEFGLTHTPNIHDFLNAIIEDRDPHITGAEARKAIEFMVACFRSAVTHEPTILPIDQADEFYTSTARRVPD